MGELTGREKLLDKLRPFMLEKDLKQVLTAYVFAKYGHRGQERDSGERYFEHPRAVAELIIDHLKIKDDWQLITAALLHDILEDSWLMDEDRLERNFEHDVAIWVKFLTKDKDSKKVYLERLQDAPWQVLMIKLCDRLHNLYSLEGCSIEKQQKQIDETQKDYYDLCDVLLERVPEQHKEKAELLRYDIRLVCESHVKRLASLLNR